mmetsp:Transcript_39057/g.63083  ORF Transcript_39057/g.63083 Transcript_39057/m.63083 type:complete len:204 (-) Transcript_39057:218-829(-)
MCLMLWGFNNRYALRLFPHRVTTVIVIISLSSILVLGFKPNLFFWFLFLSFLINFDTKNRLERLIPRLVIIPKRLRELFKNLTTKGSKLGAHIWLRTFYISLFTSLLTILGFTLPILFLPVLFLPKSRYWNLFLQLLEERTKRLAPLFLDSTKRLGARLLDRFTSLAKVLKNLPRRLLGFTRSLCCRLAQHRCRFFKGLAANL